MTGDLLLAWPRSLDSVLRLTIPGRPTSQGNPQPFTSGGMAYPKSTVNHRNLVVALLLAEWRPRPAITEAVRVVIRFGFARPASHFLPANTRRPVRELRADAPTHHTQKPDTDKCVRLLFDAATVAGVFADDCLVTRLQAEKLWADVDYTELTIYREGN